MTRQAIIEKTIQVINQLPQEKATEISDFVDFIAKKYEDEILTQGIQSALSKGKSFDFLNNDKEEYTLDDLKEKFHD